MLLDHACGVPRLPYGGRWVAPPCVLRGSCGPPVSSEACCVHPLVS